MKRSKALVHTRMKWLEPPWKILLSNKAIMAVLWDMYPDSPYLLETSLAPIAGIMSESHVKAERDKGLKYQSAEIFWPDSTSRIQGPSTNVTMQFPNSTARRP